MRLVIRWIFKDLFKSITTNIAGFLCPVCQVVKRASSTSRSLGPLTDFWLRCAKKKTFLALLNCASRANATARASVVRHPAILSSIVCRHRPSALFQERIKQTNEHFWTDSYSTNLQIFFFRFSNFQFFFNFVNMGPYGSESFKTPLLTRLLFFSN